MSRSTNRAEKWEPVTDRNAVLLFGKYKGESVQDILDCDPNYLVWLHNNTDFELGHELLEEAEEGGKPNHAFKGWTDRKFLT